MSILPWPEDDDDDIVIFETVPSSPPEEFAIRDGIQGNSMRPINLDDVEEQGDGVPSNLELDVESVDVRRISAVEFHSCGRLVTRIQQTKEQRDSLAREISKLVRFDQVEGDF